MKRTILEMKEILLDQSGIVKYSTQVENVYIYEVQLGWGWRNQILKDQKNKDAIEYGQKSIIITYKDYINGIGFCGGICSIDYTYGIKSKFKIC